jgi:hypothetical protein
MVDRTLDRLPSKPDPVRMSLFNVADLTAGLKPRSYTWKVGIWLDQLKEGSCVPHGWTPTKHQPGPWSLTSAPTNYPNGPSPRTE